MLTPIRFLLTILEGDVHSAVVSTYGVQLTTFPPSSAEGGFSATSFSAKGRYIAGFDSTDDGHVLLSSELQIADAYGRWIAPVANASAAMQPYFASSGLGLAFVDPFTGILHVGHLEISYR